MLPPQVNLYNHYKANKRLIRSHCRKKNLMQRPLRSTWEQSAVYQ